MVEIFEGDIGTKIILDSGQNIEAATVRKIMYRKPDKTTGEWNGTLEGVNAVRYTTVDGDLDVPGTWLLQLYVELPDPVNWKGSGSVVRFDVIEKI